MAHSVTIHDICPSQDAVATPALRTDTMCGPYRVVRRLAVGGVGDVYEAVHTVLGRRAALKVLQLRHADRAELAERLAQEARVLSEIRHPNMVTVYDAGLLESPSRDAPGAEPPPPLMWMAMEYLEGRTLRDTLWPNHRLPPLQALEYARQVALGVGAAHAEGAVHRDLKPENVMLCHDGRVVVLDLGTAKYLRATNLRATQRIMGTVAYMSPEHLTGEDVDFRSDVYSLGLVLWEMLVGYHPYSRSNSTADLPRTLDLARCQIEVVPPPMHRVHPDLPPFLWHVVGPALQKAPKDRYADMAVFANVLRQGIERLSATGVGAPNAPLAPGPSGPSRPEPIPTPTEVLPEEAPTRTQAAAPAAQPSEQAAPRSEDAAPRPKQESSARAAPSDRAAPAGHARPGRRRPRGLTQEEIQRALERAAQARMAKRPPPKAPWYRHWAAAVACGVLTGTLAYFLYRTQWVDAQRTSEAPQDQALHAPETAPAPAP